MKAEIIAIGDEILIGQTVDTNSAWIASELNKSGIEITGIAAIPDVADRIVKSLAAAIRRSNLVLVTGGLGPTSDDITKKTLCEFFGTTLMRDEAVLKNINDLFGRRGMPINENNVRQADVPASCTVLMNRMGTAPGMWFEKDGAIIVSMPGVPYEMKHIITEKVMPKLVESGFTPAIEHRNIMTYGLPEAHLAERLIPFESQLPEGIKLAYLPSSGIIKLRLTARIPDSASAGKILDQQVAILDSMIPELIYAHDEVLLEEAIGILLKNKHITISTAESCTGGNISRLITSVPGCSEYFTGSVIAYSNHLKKTLLGVSQKTLDEEGAVSIRCAVEMAEGVKRLTGSDISVATTGIAGPGGATQAKPVGTVCIAVATGRETVSGTFIYGFERNLNIRRFSLAALDMVRRQIIRL
ncbi:MAG: competence/damage-inducible protein A [Bacteroidales bacterium]|nr:competence/damage-inducible protein A [Bacteroidales bacterium]